MDEGSRRAKQALARQGTGPQRVEVVKEVAQDLIHELLGQILPSRIGEPLEDRVDPHSYIATYEPFAQAEVKS